MAKTLTIRNEVYNKLVAVKYPDESFSELFERLVDKEGSIEILKRLRGSIVFGSPAEKETFLSEIRVKRGDKRS